MTSVWIFGYGSLIWRPGFEYESSMVGHIKGFSRVFFQGNDKHRGTPTKPGRVATLLENGESEVWGRAFSIRIDKSSSYQKALEYLDEREAKQGGYARLTTVFYPRDPFREPLNALVYVALPTNDLYLGSKSYPEMAKEIVESHGDCGPNVEYVLNLADFMRDEVGNIDDEHLFMLEMHILTELENQTEENASFKAAWKRNDEYHCTGSSCASVSDTKHMLTTDEEAFASTVVVRKLRCVDI